MAATSVLVAVNGASQAAELRDQVEGLGYAVAGTTNSARDSVRLARQVRPDLVLMDIRLLDGDGVEAADAIRQGGGPPVVFLTALGDLPALARARLSEPFGYVHKPCSGNDLRAAIEVAVVCHRCEQAVRDSEERHRVTIQSIADGVIALDADCRVTLINPAAERLTGWTQAEARGQTLEAVLPLVLGEDRTPAPNLAREAMRRLSPVTLPAATLLVTRDGREIPVEESAAPVAPAGGLAAMGAVVSFRDISDRLRAGAALRASERREGLAAQAAGMAVHFHNLLAPIQGCAELLRPRLAADPDGLALLAMIESAVQFGGRLTQELIAVAKAGGPGPD